MTWQCSPEWLMASSTDSNRTDDGSANESPDAASYSDLSGFPLEETAAPGSEDVPCRAFHPTTHLRDGHAASDCALGWNEFPPKPLATEAAGVDEMGPWIRLQPDDRLFLHHRVVHMAASCPFCDRIHRSSRHVTASIACTSASIMMLTTSTSSMLTAAAARMSTCSLTGDGQWSWCVAALSSVMMSPLLEGTSIFASVKQFFTTLRLRLKVCKYLCFFRWISCVLPWCMFPLLIPCPELCLIPC